MRSACDSVVRTARNPNGGSTRHSYTVNNREILAPTSSRFTVHCDDCQSKMWFEIFYMKGRS
jgi:hypothetical protein